MLLPLSWLKEFVKCNDPIESVGNIFYELGFGVESTKNNVIDLEITPNRGDALSIIGLAREYAAATNQQLKVNDYRLPTIKNDKEKVKINITTDKIPLYCGVVIENVNVVKSSPEIINKLRTFGISPINAIVDITNLIMIEYGQPLHAFDTDKLKGSVLNLKGSNGGESITTLNNKIYSLKKDMLVGYDSDGPIDLIGIQGGLASGVTQKTTSILIQAIDCDPVTIRKTSKLLNLTTEASFRFERGIDRKMAINALAKAISMILQFCKGTVTQVYQDTRYENRNIEIDFSRISSFLGTEISRSVAVNLLKRLGFNTDKNIVSVPSWRLFDIHFEEDLIEEITRLYGYNNLVSTPLQYANVSKLKTDQIWKQQREIAQELINLGFDEIMTYSFLSEKEVLESDESDLREVKNPLSRDYAFLRRSLIPLLIKAAEHNTWYPAIAVFEIGNVFSKNNESQKIALLSTSKIDFIPNCTTINPQQLPYNTRKKYYTWEGNIGDIKDILPKKSASLIDLKNIKYRPFSKFPPLVRDISCILANDIEIEAIRSTILESNQNILIVEPFDIYTSESLGQNKKSIALHIIFDSPTMTLVSADIDKIMEKIYHRLKTNFSAIIR